uniref:6-phosphofructo-2-kinase n=1 Tax=Caenorhabditis japonica TaxID=281687 RepID=A0A8R1HGE6_CAEJA
MPRLLPYSSEKLLKLQVNSPDYKGLMTAEQAKEDFMRRIENYAKQYEPLDELEHESLSFIKVINAGRSFKVHQVRGHVQSRVVYFLMNIHLLPRSIYLTRHGQSEYNGMGRLGGDSPLTENGQKYAAALADFFEEEEVEGLRVWCSQKVRAAQTAQYLKPDFHTEYWKALDELDAGICEGLTYEDIQQRYPKQADDRAADKYHYRYPSGESYEDVVSRLEPVIMELERQANVLVVSHQAVLRCILAYFYDRSLPELPYIDIPLHSLVKLTPRAYHCDSTIYALDLETGQVEFIYFKRCKGA